MPPTPANQNDIDVAVQVAEHNVLVLAQENRLFLSILLSGKIVNYAHVHLIRPISLFLARHVLSLSYVSLKAFLFENFYLVLTQFSLQAICICSNFCAVLYSFVFQSLPFYGLLYFYGCIALIITYVRSKR